MTTSERGHTTWLHRFGEPATWSVSGFVVSVVVATIVFVFGNIALFLSSPLLLFLANTLLTAVSFVVVVGMAKAVEGRLGPTRTGLTITATVVAVSALRGVALDLLIVSAGLGDTEEPLTRALISVTVFGPGLVLSVLAVRAISQWRQDEATIKNLSDDIRTTQTIISDTIDAHISDVTSHVKTSLGPKLATLSALSPDEAKESLNDMVATIVKPVSRALHDTAPVSLAPGERSATVAFGEFVDVALRGKPLAPIVTGILFTLTLLPRYLTGEGITLGLAIALAMGTAMVAGTLAINALSSRFYGRLPRSAHLASIAVALVGLGAGLGVFSNVMVRVDIGFDNVFIVGSAATLTLASLLGGVVNASKYFQQQRALVTALQKELDTELTRARQLQWHRQSALSNWLHGPLQAAMNAARIRLTQQEATPDSLTTELDTIATELRTLLTDIETADNTPTDLALVIGRIGAMWESVTTLTWDVDHTLVDAVTNTPLARAIGDVLVESVFNAIKHQAPDTVAVSLQNDPSGHITLTVTHPGHLADNVTQGLGTSVYHELTTQHTLLQESDSVVFSAQFPSLVTYGSQA
jgi:hypothetical protein